MRCLLIEHEIGLVLIDNGAGSKENDKFYDIYGIENTGSAPSLSRVPRRNGSWRATPVSQRSPEGCSHTSSQADAR